MRSWWKLAVAALLGAAIAIPAAVIARGGISVLGDADLFAVEGKANVETQGTGYTPVGITLPETTGPISATVSAQMTQGKARFRLISSEASAQPGSSTFYAKSSNSFTFVATESCPPLALEWKRQGNTPAVAKQVSVLAVLDGGASACG